MVWFKRRHLFFAFLLLVLVVLSGRLTQFSFARFSDLANMIDFLSRWFPVDWAVLPILMKESLITLAMAFLGSFLGLLVALPASFIAARTTNESKFFYSMTRIFLSFLRSVPEIVFGLIFVTVFGLGPFPAVMAIWLHNVGVLGKLLSELVEAAEKGPQEAMRAVGAQKKVGELVAILPQIWPNVLSHYFYRFEVAIRTSLILGIVGGGGIGQRLFIHFNTFQYPAVALDVLLIMIMVVAVDFFGGFVRKKVI